MIPEHLLKFVTREELLSKVKATYLAFEIEQNDAVDSLTKDELYIILCNLEKDIHNKVIVRKDNVTEETEYKEASIPEVGNTEVMPTPITRPSLFGDTINEDFFTEYELKIRAQFLEELKNSPGCSGCQRNALVRKYSLILKSNPLNLEQN